MRTRTFSEEEKQEIKSRMIQIGIPMLKEQGMSHMSITKLTTAVGIGKSTFYNFYTSKEAFVSELMDDHRRRIQNKLRDGLKGREKYTKEESIHIIRSMISNANNLFQNFTYEDEAALQKMHEKNGTAYLDLNHETQVIQLIGSMMDGIREDLDYAVIANLMKIIVFTSEQRTMLHASGYERTIDQLVDLLIKSIFE